MNHTQGREYPCACKCVIYLHVNMHLSIKRRKGETERGGGRETERETERQRDLNRDRETERQKTTARDRDTTERQRDRETENQRGREPERQRGREAERQRGRDRETEGDIETERQRVTVRNQETERYLDRKRQRQTCREEVRAGKQADRRQIEPHLVQQASCQSLLPLHPRPSHQYPRNAPLTPLSKTNETPGHCFLLSSSLVSVTEVALPANLHILPLQTFCRLFLYFVFFLFFWKLQPLIPRRACRIG